MSLFDKIKKDSLQARKERTDKEKIAIYSVIIGEIEKVGLSRDVGNREICDEDVLSVLKKLAKSVEATIELAMKKEIDTSDYHKDMVIIKSYLPKAIDTAEVETVVSNIINNLTDDEKSSKAAIGLVVGKLKEHFGSAFNGGTMMPIVKGKLE